MPIWTDKSIIFCHLSPAGVSFQKPFSTDAVSHLWNIHSSFFLLNKIGLLVVSVCPWTKLHSIAPLGLSYDTVLANGYREVSAWNFQESFLRVASWLVHPHVHACTFASTCACVDAFPFLPEKQSQCWQWISYLETIRQQDCANDSWEEKQCPSAHW